MKDKELLTTIRNLMLDSNNGMPSKGFDSLNYLVMDQPLQQGIESNPTIYYSIVSDKAYGFISRKNKWDSLNQVMVHEETQVYITRIQYMGWRVRTADPNEFTANDIIRALHDLFISEWFLLKCKEYDINVLRIQEINNVPISDDQERFNYLPSFDAKFIHKNVWVNSINYITDIYGNIKRV